MTSTTYSMLFPADSRAFGPPGRTLSPYLEILVTHGEPPRSMSVVLTDVANARHEQTGMIRITTFDAKAFTGETVRCSIRADDSTLRHTLTISSVDL